MAEEKFNAYITPKALEEIIVLDDQYQNLNSIFKKYADLVVDMTDDEWEEMCEDTENDVLQFSIQNDVSIICLHDYFKDLYDNLEMVSQKNRSLFILDIDSKKASELTESYGVLVEDSNSINDDIFQFGFKAQFQKDETVDQTRAGWENLLGNLNFPKGNSAVITDNYLMTNEKDGKNIGVENLKQILSAILPMHLDIPYHLLIICKHPDVSKERTNHYIGEIKSYIRTIRDYDVCLEVAFGDTIHCRKIISNYYVLTADKGFELYSPSDKFKIYSDNEISVSSIFPSPKFSMGDSEFRISEIYLSQIKSKLEGLKEYTTKFPNDYSKRILGDCKKDKSVNNRIVNN